MKQLFPLSLSLLQLRKKLSDAMDKQKEAERDREAAELRVLEVCRPMHIPLSS